MINPLAVITYGVGFGVLETVYFAAFMLVCLAAALLGKWTTKRLLLFIFSIAVIISVLQASVVLLNASYNINRTPIRNGTPV